MLPFPAQVLGRTDFRVVKGNNRGIGKCFYIGGATRGLQIQTTRTPGTTKFSDEGRAQTKGTALLYIQNLCQKSWWALQG